VKHRIPRGKRIGFALLAFLVLVSGIALGGPAQAEEAGAADTGTEAAPRYNYAEALQKALFFYDAQRSGDLPDEFRVEWRADSHLKDGQDQGLDLTGGWYDAGDDVKWTNTMSFAATLLAWGGEAYGDGYRSSGQLPYLKGSLKWVSDYFLKAFTYGNLDDISTYRIYTDVGSIKNEYAPNEHNGWYVHEMAEVGLTGSRPVWYGDKDAPATTQVADMAATMAATAVIFRLHSDGPEDDAYADLLEDRASRLFRFANTYRDMKLHDDTGAIVSWPDYHYDSEYWTELAWAAIWLHKAAALAGDGYDGSYLAQAKALAGHFGQGGLYFSGFHLPVAIELANLTNEQIYRTRAENELTAYTNDAKSPGGMTVGNNFGNLRHANNKAFAMFVYADRLPDGPKKDAYIAWARGQLDYALGSNPANRSYLVGFAPPGKSNSSAIHHRSAMGAFAGYEHLIFTRPEFDYTPRHILYGALLGGPDNKDQWAENIEPAQHEVTLDFNAGITGNLARMVQFEGGTPLANFPEPEPRDPYDGLEYFVEAAPVEEGEHYTVIRAELNNRSSWPPTLKDALSFRYYFELEPGTDPGQITASLTDGNGAAIAGPTHAGGNVYYVTVDFTGTPIYPADRVPFVSGFDPKWRKVVKFRLESAGGWDNGNDWSYYGLQRGPVKRTAYIPVYDAGALLYGLEPGSAVQNDAPAAPEGAFIVGSGYTPPTSMPVNLTEEGGLDWAHWSYEYTVKNHKAGGGNQISDLTRIGSSNVGRSTDGVVNYQWFDGDPSQTVQTYGTRTETFQSGVGNGFAISVPAGTEPRTLRVFVGGFNSRGTLTASLSDGSAPDYKISFGNWHGSNGHYSKVMTLSYRAASENQVLNVSWIQTEGVNGQFGKVNFNAATLNEGYTAPPSPYYARPLPPADIRFDRAPLGDRDRVYLSWTPSPNAKYYTVYRSASPEGPWMPIREAGSENNYFSSIVMDKDRFVDLDIPRETNYYYRVSATNFAGESEMVDVVDETAPTAPGGLTVLGRSDTSVVLGWEPSSDNVGVDGYRIHADGDLLGTVPEERFTASGLEPGRSYGFTIVAVDGSGNASEPSAVLNAATLASPDASPPGAPAQLAVTERSDRAVALSWSPADDDNGVVDYRVYVDDRLAGHTNGRTSFRMEGLAGGTTYAVRVKAVDAQGNESADGASLTVATSDWRSGDIGSVGRPGGYSVTEQGEFTIKASGSDIWGSGDSLHYVYKELQGNGGIVARIASQSNTDAWAKAGVMIRESLDPGSRHAMAIATPGSGIRLQYRPAAGGESYDIDSGAGGAPIWLRLERLGDTIKAYRSDDGAAWEPIGTADVPMQAGVWIGLAVTSHNNMTLGEVKADSVRLLGPDEVTDDKEPPTAPTGLIVSEVTDSGAKVAWTASTDNVSVAGYDIYLDGVKAGTSKTTSFLLTGLQPETTYSVTVKARDSSGLESAPSEAVRLTTEALPPDVTVELIHEISLHDALFGKPGWHGEHFRYQTFTAPDSGGLKSATVRVRKQRADAVLSDVTVSLYDTENGKPSVKLAEARIPAGSVTGAYAEHTVELVRGGLVGGKTYAVVLSQASPRDEGYEWSTAPVDPEERTGRGGDYEIVDESHFGDSWLRLVFAGAPSPDAEPPSVPSGLEAVSITADAVHLRWQPSADNRGVAGYRVYRNGEAAGTNLVTGAEHTVGGLQPDTAYTFTVTAVDYAGNESAPSAKLEARTAEAADALPDGWHHRDVGSTGLAGSARYVDGTFHVSGAGEDIENPKDGFHYVYTTLDGDGSIVARVRSQQRTHDWAKAGLMIREELGDRAKHASILLTGANGLQFQVRKQANGQIEASSAGGGAAPVWLKLTRTGNRFAAYTSADGLVWGEPVGTAQLEMSGSVHIGLAVTSHDVTKLSAAAFDGVAIASGTGDNTAPAGSVAFAEGPYASNREVRLQLQAQDDREGPLDMMASEDPSFAGAQWEAFAAEQPFLLSEGDGAKTVHVRFRDAAGNVSETASASIVLDTAAPVIELPGYKPVYGLAERVRITCEASDGGTGVASATCETIDALAADLGDGEHLFNAAAVDRAGNRAERTAVYRVEASLEGLKELTLLQVAEPYAGGLTAKLDAAAGSRDSGQWTAMNHQLEAFIQQAEAKRGKGIGDAAIDQLIRYARSLMRAGG